MAKTISKLTIDIHPVLKVDKDTAETCLKLVEMYCNQENAFILHKYEGGKCQLLLREVSHGKD